MTKSMYDKISKYKSTFEQKVLGVCETCPVKICQNFQELFSFICKGSCKNNNLLLAIGPKESVSENIGIFSSIMTS